MVNRSAAAEHFLPDRHPDAFLKFEPHQRHLGVEDVGGAVDVPAAEQRHNLHLDDVDNYQKRIYFWQDVPRRAKYNEIWNEVKAAQ